MDKSIELGHCLCQPGKECALCIQLRCEASIREALRPAIGSSDIERRLSNLERALGQMVAQEFADVGGHPGLGPAVTDGTLEAGKEYLIMDSRGARILRTKSEMQFTADAEGDYVAEILPR